MVDSQPDQYTKIPNQVFEQIISGKFNGTQYKLIMAVCRFTFGFQRDRAELSISFLSEATSLNPRNIRRELETLTRRGIILEYKEQRGTKARAIGINKDTKQWLEGVYSPPVERVKSPPLESAREGQETPTENPREGQTAPPREGELTPAREGQLTPQEIKKENIKENIYSISAEKILSVWNEQKIIRHEMTDDINNAIEIALLIYGFEKVVLGIKRYAMIFKDPDYFFSYKWSLINFLGRKRGLPEFFNGGEKWENYMARGQPQECKSLPVDDLGDPVPGAQDRTPI